MARVSVRARSELIMQHLGRFLQSGTTIEPGHQRRRHDQPDRQIHEEFFSRHVDVLTKGIAVSSRL
jgi:hypothetical protein